MASTPRGPRSPRTTVGSGRGIPWLLDVRARDRADHPSLIWEPFDGPGRMWTYAELARDVSAVAGGLRRRGVGPGDRVIIHLENCPEFILTWFACLRLGAIAVFTNTRSAVGELSYFAGHSGASVVVTQPSFADTVALAITGARAVVVTDNNAGAAVDSVDRPSRADSWSALLGADHAPAYPSDSFDPAMVLYSSGTTGRPKGIVWTHANSVWAAKVNGVASGMSRSDVTQVFLPLFHTNAQAYSVLPTLWAGGTIVLQPKFSASRFWTVAARHKATFASQLTFMLRALANRDVPAEHTFTRWGMSVSGHPTESLFRVPMVGWYGMTETVGVPIVGDLHVPNTLGTIGHASPFYEIAVLNADDGSPVGEGETGELRVRGIPGLSLFAGYLDNDEATESSFDDQGFFITGDRVTLHEGGAISYTERSKDMLKVGGENVAATEIERVVLAVPGVSEAAVVAGPDPMLDEVPVAFVVAKPGLVDTGALVESIIVACRRDLADFKIPREIRFLDALPKATLGKITKRRLREMLRKSD